MSKPTNEVYNRYRKKAMKSFSVTCHRENDRAIIEWLETKENKSQAIKNALKIYISEHEKSRQRSDKTTKND